MFSGLLAWKRHLSPSTLYCRHKVWRKFFLCLAFLLGHDPSPVENKDFQLIKQQSVHSFRLLKECPSDLNQRQPFSIHKVWPLTLSQWESLCRNPLFYTRSFNAAQAQREAEAKGKTVSVYAGGGGSCFCQSWLHTLYTELQTLPLSLTGKWNIPLS